MCLMCMGVESLWSPCVDYLCVGSVSICEVFCCVVVLCVYFIENVSKDYSFVNMQCKFVLYMGCVCIMIMWLRCALYVVSKLLNLPSFKQLQSILSSYFIG